MKRDFWEAKHTCTCGNAMKKKTLLLEGMHVRSWECPSCKDTVLHPEDAQKMLVFNKLKRGIKVKIGELGQSLIFRFPKDAATFYKIKKGEELTFKAEDPHKFVLVH